MSLHGLWAEIGRRKLAVPLLVLVTVGSSPVLAQPTTVQPEPPQPSSPPLTTLMPSAALNCLTPTEELRGAPEYPFLAFKRGETGRVSAELTFTGPDLPPTMTPVLTVGDESFIKAVEAYVGKFRVPCMRSSSPPVKLRFEFVFKPDTRTVYTSRPADVDSARRRAQVACIRHASGGVSPPYPARALRTNVSGRVITQLKFEAPDRPPVASVFARRSASALRDAITDWVDDLRMPCLTDGPVEVAIQYNFQFVGEAYGFKPGLDFISLLRMMAPEVQVAMPPDTTAMACPFSLSLYYRRPDLRNEVKEVGSQDPSRLPFIRWLETADFKAPARFLDIVYGDQTTFEVPCLKIDSTATKE